MINNWKSRISIVSGLMFHLFLSSCSLFILDDPTQELPLDEVLKISVDKDSIEADGQSSLMITAELGELADASQSIKFKTSGGKLSDLASTVSPESETIIEIEPGSKTALARLTSDLMPDKNISLVVSVGEIERFRNISFIRSYPETATFSADSYILEVSSNSKADLRLETYKDLGTTSDRTMVRLMAMPVDSNSSVRVDLPQIVITENGVASAEIRPIGQGTGDVIVRAAIPLNAIGDSLYKELVITFQ